jgi:hypothetical protein
MDLIIFRILQGVKCKTASSSSSGTEEAGHGQELLAIGGAGGTGDEEAGGDLEPDEEGEGNLERRSPAADAKGNDRETESTAPAGFFCGSSREAVVRGCEAGRRRRAGGLARARA